MRKVLVGVAFTLAFTLSSGAALSAEKVNIGTPAWTGAQAIAALLQAVVVERIGGEANLVPGNNATIFQGMDQGKGDIDVHPDVWLPNQES
jgi:glycine betaine/proline transport system substrate-binding protein